MKIAIIGAAGQAGSRIAKESLAKGHEVVAIVRDKTKTDLDQVIEKGLMDLTKEDLAGFDIVVNAISAFTPETLPLHTDGLVHLANLLSTTDTRLFVVGGAGSLYMDKTHSLQRKDSADFPEEFKPLANAMSQGLDRLRTFTDLNWTYVSPADDFEVEHPVTGDYLIGGEEFLTNADGQSMISYDDYAKGFVSLFDGDYTRKRLHIIRK